jgi:hypothetical protein
VVRAKSKIRAAPLTRRGLFLLALYDSPVYGYGYGYAPYAYAPAYGYDGGYYAPRRYYARRYYRY